MSLENRKKISSALMVNQAIEDIVTNLEKFEELKELLSEIANAIKENKIENLDNIPDKLSKNNFDLLENIMKIFARVVNEQNNNNKLLITEIKNGLINIKPTTTNNEQIVKSIERLSQTIEKLNIDNKPKEWKFEVYRMESGLIDKIIATSN